MSTYYHELKTWPVFFAAILRGDKTFEIRKNDRDFKQGDYLMLKEWNPETREYTGRVTFKYISYLLDGNNVIQWGVQVGYVVMSLQKVDVKQRHAGYIQVADTIERLLEALKEHQRFNRIGNDLDAYLGEMAEWALGEIEEKPNPENFGIPNLNQ